MLHLPAERLAALADEPPTRLETEHLAFCADCRRERDAYLRLNALASDESTRLAPAISEWSAIATALRAEGVLAPRAGDAPASSAGASADVVPIAARRAGHRVVTWFSSATWARAAAALMLVAGGAIGGRLSTGHPAIPGTVAGAPRDTVAVVIGDTLPTFRSATEALAHLTAAEQHYQYAATFLAQFDSGAAPVEDSKQAYETRLAALDNVAAAARQALFQAPHDPIINRYYLATLGARRATIQQLNTVLPAGERVSQY